MNETASSQPLESLIKVSHLLVRQKFEHWELLGVECRNKYEILHEDGTPFAFAAEVKKGAFDFLSRQILGHRRDYQIHFFTPFKEVFLIGHHPFRWFFQIMEIRTPQGLVLGTIRWRFSLLSKHLQIEGPSGNTIFETRAPMWKPWTFLFSHLDREVASVKKRWSGVFSEILTDRDNFRIDFLAPELASSERALVLAAAVFIDLLYFEKKSGGGVASTATDLLTGA
jgi:hypothetical protein